MADKFNRTEAIQGALDMGQSIEQINRGLSSIGQKPLSSYEQTLIQDNNFGQSLGERFGEGAMNFAQGLGTILASPVEYARNKDFREAVNKEVSNYTQDVLTGNRNPIEDFTNLMLSPYGVEVNDVFKAPAQSGQRILEGAASHPFDATLDTMSILPPGLVANTLSKIPNEGFQKIRRGVMPTTKERNVNTLLNRGATESITKRSDFEDKLTNIATNPELPRYVRELTTGTGDASKAKTELQNFTKELNDRMVKLGLDPQEYRRTSVAQKVLEDLDPARKGNIYLQNVQKAIDNPTLDNIKALGVDEVKFKQLVSDANKLADEGKLATITQRNIYSDVDHRLVDLNNLGQGITRQRTFGTATPEQVARNFDRGYRNLYSLIERAENSRDILGEIAKEFGRKISPNDINKVRSNEVVISPKEYRDNVSQLFGRNTNGNIEKLANDVTKGANANTLSKYSDDLYVVPKADVEAWRNYTAGIDYQSTLGRLTQNLRPVIGAFKSNVLTRPSYIAGNRIGNLSLGAIGGADYATALRPSMRKYIPEYIKQSTSYHGYDAVNSNNPITAYRDSATRLRNAIKDIQDPETKLPDRLSAAGQVVQRTQEVALPIRQLFQAESQLELLDRSAVYFNEAKKLARETGKSFETVLKEGLNNSQTQRTLIDRVNSVLGDYVGRNYYIDPTLREFASTITPFYKVITTSADVGRQQLYRNPFRMQAFARIPSRAGNEIQRIDREVGYQPSDNDPRGGMITTPTYSRRFPAEAIFNNYHPLNAPVEIVQRIFGPSPRQGEGTGLAGIGGIVAGNITPITGILNALEGKDPYGNPVVGPNSYKLGNQVITLDDNGNRLEQPDIIGGITGYIGRYLLPSATLWNSTLGPIAGATTKRNFYRPTSRSIFGQIGDTFGIPYLYEGNPNKPIANSPSDVLINQLGFRTRDVYYPLQNKISPYDMRQLNRRRYMDEQRLIMRGN